MDFHTIRIAEAALPAHLAHGDLAGPCNALCAELCDDGDACTVDDTGDCEENGCPGVRGATDCSDGNLCTTDLCDPTDGCSNPTAVTCTPPDLCTTSACDPLTGLCTDTPRRCSRWDACDVETGQCECALAEIPTGAVEVLCFSTTLAPGDWWGWILQRSTEQPSGNGGDFSRTRLNHNYVLASPLLARQLGPGDGVTADPDEEAFAFQAEFNGSTWFDVLRLHIPVAEAPRTVGVVVYYFD